MKEYGVKLNLNTSEFQKKLQDTKNKIIDFTKKAKENFEAGLKSDYDIIDLDDLADQYEKELEQVKAKISKVGIPKSVRESLEKEAQELENALGRIAKATEVLENPFKNATNFFFTLGQRVRDVKEGSLKPYIDTEEEIVDETDDLNKNTKTTISIFQNFDRGIKKGVNSIKRFTLSILGVQSVYSMLSRATHAYMSQDDALHNRLQANWIALGAIMEPIVTRLIDLFTKLVGYINVFIKTITGGKVDLIAKAMDKVDKKSKRASASTKSLASGLDEITNLDMNNGGFGDADIPSISDYLNDLNNMELNPKVVEKIKEFAEWLKKAWEWVKKNKDEIIKFGIIIGSVFAGAKIGLFIGNLAKMFGLVSGAGVASFGAWGFAIAGIVADLYLAWELGNKLVDLWEAKKQQEEASNKVMDSYSDGLRIVQEQMEKNNKEREEGLITEEQWRRRNNELMQGAEQNLQGINKKIETGRDLTKEQREELDKQKKAIEGLSGKSFNTTIKANISWSDQAKNFIKNNADILQLGANAIGAGTLFSFIRNHVGFAKGNVAYGPTVAEFGEYSGANSNPEITAPQNIMRETLFEALTDALPLIGSQQQQDNREIVLNVNGREFARATYGDYQTEAKRVGSSNVAIRRG